MTFDEMVEDIRQKALSLAIEPEEMRDLREQVLAAVENAHGLEVLFRCRDQGSYLKAIYLKAQYDDLYDDQMGKPHTLH